MTVLIDTCVIIDALQRRQPFDTAAMQIIEVVAQKRINGIITAKSVTDIHYLYMRYIHDKAKTLDMIIKLFRLFMVADTLADDCYNACFSTINDYEDGVMEQTAKRLHIDYIVTRNLKDYRLSTVKVISPDEFLSYLQLVEKNNNIDESI